MKIPEKKPYTRDDVHPTIVEDVYERGWIGGVPYAAVRDRGSITWSVTLETFHGHYRADSEDPEGAVVMLANRHLRGENDED